MCKKEQGFYGDAGPVIDKAAMREEFEKFARENLALEDDDFKPSPLFERYDSPLTNYPWVVWQYLYPQIQSLREEAARFKYRCEKLFLERDEQAARIKELESAIRNAVEYLPKSPCRDITLKEALKEQSK